MTDTSITATRMQELLDAGQAQPLLADHFPGPVRMDQQWWHVPTTGPHAELGDFVPAPTELEIQLDRLAERRRAADLSEPHVADPGVTP